MWKLGLSLASVIVVLVALTDSTRTTSAQAVDPSTLPLLQVDQLEYLGGFRLPVHDDFSFGEGAIAFRPDTGGLYVGTRAIAGWRVAEIAIPPLVNNGDVTQMNVAQFNQLFADPMEGHKDEVEPADTSLNSLLVYGGRLYGTVSSFYDANDTQRKSHFSRSLTLNEPNTFSGWSEVTNPVQHAGFVSGLLAAVPEVWRERLGGPALTGNCCLSVIMRTSWGPAAFAFDPANVGQESFPATPLLYYNGEHPTLGLWSHSNPTYGGTTQITGLVMIEGTRTALYFGRNGIGEFCYGDGTNDLSKHDVTEGTTHWCYDPVNSGKGQHAYPYSYQFWAYDLNELARVKLGEIEPWVPEPYKVRPFEFPTTDLLIEPGSATYDAQNQIIYVAQRKADPPAGYQPVIHAFRVPINALGVTDVAISSDKASPQAPNTTITFAATPTGGTPPLQYKWFLNDGESWHVERDWATSHQFVWTPSTSGSGYQIRVWARSAANNGDVPEAQDTVSYAISGSSIVTTLSITSDKASPQPAGTAITWTAVATGGTAPLQYKWLFWNGGSSEDLTGWTTSHTFTWTPIYGNPNYAMRAWVRSADNTSDTPEAEDDEPFPTTGPGPATAVTLSSSHQSPQPASTTVTWTATPTGGVPQQEYKWLIFDGGVWTVAVNWTTSNTFGWTPTRSDPHYKIGVWVRSSGNTNDAAETSTSSDWYAIQ